MNKTVLYTVLGVATALGGYFLYKRIKRPVEFIGDVDINENTNTDPKPKPSQSSKLPLKKGSKGEEVKQLQRFLIAEGYDIGMFGVNRDGVDGDFGNLTLKAVKENQNPFSVFKSMYPNAVYGQVSKDFFDLNIKGRY